MKVTRNELWIYDSKTKFEMQRSCCMRKLNTHGLVNISHLGHSVN